jgi:uncharacterized protein YbdZ (MbtH family)
MESEMTKQEAVALAVAHVKTTGFTVSIGRRGNSYQAWVDALPIPRGWKVVEMIGWGNVHNYEQQQ